MTIVFRVTGLPNGLNTFRWDWPHVVNVGADIAQSKHLSYEASIEARCDKITQRIHRDVEKCDYDARASYLLQTWPIAAVPSEVGHQALPPHVSSRSVTPLAK